MRGASFHMTPVADPEAASIHNRRTWTADHPKPKYLLRSEHRLGHWEEIAGDVGAVHAAKMALASRQARQAKNYSPVWEGVLNLPHPTGRADREHMGQMVRDFAKGYEKITGHKVIAAHVHLDEGRMEDGKPVYNAHAHVTVDRTDERGRAILMTRDQLRQVQVLAAEVTGLERGQNAEVTGLKHLPHQAYRALARTGRLRGPQQQTVSAWRDLPGLDTQQMNKDLVKAEYGLRWDREAKVWQIKTDHPRAHEAITKWGKSTTKSVPPRDIDRELALAEAYGELRGLMKASGRATQADYQRAKENRGNAAWIAALIAHLTPQEARQKAQEAPKLSEAGELPHQKNRPVQPRPRSKQHSRDDGWDI